MLQIKWYKEIVCNHTQDEKQTALLKDPVRT